MNAILQFLDLYEIWIYLLLGLVGFIYLRKFALALKEWRESAFGLERDNAQRRLSEATSILVLVFMMGISEFLVVTFVTPNFSASQPIATPTLNILATQIGTLAPGATTQTPGAPAQASTAIAELVIPTPVGNGCIPGQIEITYPTAGAEIKGNVDLKGVVNVPNFGFYKYEFSQAGSDTWATVQASDTEPVAPDYKLGSWNTSLVVPGDYLLRLVVTDNQAHALPPCIVPVRVAPPG